MTHKREHDTLLGPRFSAALTYAADIHRRQLRKGTKIPYIAHVLGVTSIALTHGATEDEAIAALLHDAIEDAPKQLGNAAAEAVRNWIRLQFGERVLKVVEGCTQTDVSSKPSWRKRREKYVEHIAKQMDPSIVLVSASDKLHNANAILSDFRQVGENVFKRFNKEAGKVGVLGYYRGLVKAYRGTGHHPSLVTELDRVVSEVERETGVKGTWPLS